MSTAKQRRALEEAGFVERDHWYWQKRRERYTFDQIAYLAGQPVEKGGLGFQVSATTVFTRIKKYRDMRIAQLGDDIEGQRLEAIEELDELSIQYREIAQPFFRDEHGVVHRTPVSVRMGALDGMARLVDRRARLSGLDRPVTQKLDVTVKADVDAEIDKLFAELDDMRAKEGAPNGSPRSAEGLRSDAG